MDLKSTSRNLLKVEIKEHIGYVSGCETSKLSEKSKILLKVRLLSNIAQTREGHLSMTRLLNTGTLLQDRSRAVSLLILALVAVDTHLDVTICNINLEGKSTIYQSGVLRRHVMIEDFVLTHLKDIGSTNRFVNLKHLVVSRW